MTRRLGAEDLFTIELAGDIDVAPDASRIAYVVRRATRENEYDQAIHGFQPGSPPVRLTQGHTDHSPRFSPDGRLLGFVSRRGGSAQVWILPLSGGEAWQLTRIHGGVESFAFSPDGTRMALIVNLDERGIEPEREREEEQDPYVRHNRDVKVITELFHKLDGEGYYDRRKPQVAVVDVREGAEPRQLTAPPYRHSSLAWTRDGSAVLTCANRGPRYDREVDLNQLWRVPLDGSAPVALTPYGTLMLTDPALSPDGTLVAVRGTIASELEYDNTGLYVLPVEGGQPRRIAAESDLTFDVRIVGDMQGPARTDLFFSPDGERILTQVSRRGAVQVAEVDIRTGGVRTLTRSEGVVHAFAHAQGALAHVESDPLTPARVVWTAPGSAPTTVAEPSAEALRDVTLGPVRRFTAQSPDGTGVDGWIVEPPGREADRRYPVVLEIHGGPMMMYGDGFYLEFQYLAAHGYAVVYSNPRGSQGYGEAFCAAIRTRWGHVDYQDIMAAIDTALAGHPWMDPARVGVAGGSYGGYMTNWIVSHTDRFRAAVTMRSVVDWRAMFGTGDYGWGWMERAGGTPPWVDDTWYREQSPITYVEQVRTPILIEHQEGDLRCPIEQGEMWYTAIKWLGKAPVKFVRYAGEFHGMSRDGKPWHRVHRLRTIREWFDAYLGTGAQEKAP